MIWRLGCIPRPCSLAHLARIAGRTAQHCLPEILDQLIAGRHLVVVYRQRLQSLDAEQSQRKNSFEM